MKAIETHYKGYRFRSRLEARWAVFFDAFGIDYEYEPEAIAGFKNNSTINYLPDFFLPELNRYIEIKPRFLAKINPGDWANHMVNFIFLWDIAPLAVIFGNPWPDEYQMLIWGPDYDDSEGPTKPDVDCAVFASCRKCDGPCLAHMEISHDYTSRGGVGNSWEADENCTGFMPFGKHTCRDHEKWPLLYEGKVMEAYRAARRRRFYAPKTP